ncbi:MAG: hypothetical protein IKO68_03885 [Oscillospiraceae bacterium]|nr:hypothetical protein [Oscillospiraceae bacterium]MBR4655717.1 hypothetical protein [Oscillospiraceae bacterium]
MSVYRMTLRFNLEDAQERGAAEYLQDLRHGDGNRFVVSAVLARIKEDCACKVDSTLLDSIRRIFREEMRALPLTQENTVPALPAEEQEDQSVLDDLELFG